MLENIREPATIYFKAIGNEGEFFLIEIVLKLSDPRVKKLRSYMENNGFEITVINSIQAFKYMVVRGFYNN